MNLQDRKSSRSKDSSNRLKASINDEPEDLKSRSCTTTNPICDYKSKNDQYRDNNRPIPPPQSRSLQNLAGSRVKPIRSKSWNSQMPSEKSTSSRTSLRDSIPPSVPEELGTSSDNKDTDNDYLEMRKK
ncbi:uncharacterized protein [Chironomus tepperi]|uniref:uncharacterized protein n=1 Tax=Chironomus tepperi TaxID=113505 RepID=UPI00391F519B